MSYFVADILEDLVNRVTPSGFEKYGEVFTLRKMNDVYKRLNTQNNICRKEFAADWSQYTSSTLVDYVTLPNDWIKPYKMLPFMHFRLPNVFLNDEGITQGTWTWDFIGNEKRIYIANASITSLINFKYYSMGLTLVADNPVSDSTTEVNDPEWPEELKSLLYIETLLALNVEPTQYEIEQRQFLLNQMKALQIGAALQATGPADGGEQARHSSVTDPYSRTS